MGEQSVADRKADLIAGLRNVRERILTLASRLDTDRQEEVYLGTWSAKQMLAHLSGWDRTNLLAADEILSGELPSFYEFSGKDWASYNEMLVSEHLRDTFDEMVAHVRESHQELLDKLLETSANELWNDSGLRAKGWKVTIGRLLEAEMQDEEEHYSQLKAFIEQGLKC